MVPSRLVAAATVVGGVGGAGLVSILAFAWSVIKTPGDGVIVVLILLTIAAGITGAVLAHRKATIWESSLGRLFGESNANPTRITSLSGLIASAVERNDDIASERDTAVDGQRFVAERLEAIVAGLRDGVLIIDPDMVIVSINQAASDQLNTSPERAVGRPLVEVARDFDLVRVTRDGVERGSEQSTPIDYRRAGRQFNLRVMPIEQAGQRLAILVVQDVTDLRQLENVRKDFVANVSHELRTPLAAIRALVETLNDGALDDESVAHDFLSRVVDEVDRLNELIEDLLDLGRLESGRLPLRRAPIDVSVVVGQSIERVQHQADEVNVGLNVDVPAGLPLIDVDASRTQQVLVNLLNNAIKFSPRGSRIDVVARKSDSGVLISVRDYGLGILPEDLPRIFERFYKSDRARQSDGTGLGLAIAKHIVSSHGGQLTVVSEYEKGSTFSVELPVAEQSAAA